MSINLLKRAVCCRTGSSTRRLRAILGEMQTELFTTSVNSRLRIMRGVRRVLGIETSCDDTGAAVVDETGRILGEALNSQTSIHVEMGGILPPVARDLHQKHISDVVTNALNAAEMSVEDVDAVAVTVKPGLSLSLLVGLNFAKRLVREHRRPMIPIHHMEAHALTPRLSNKIDFPYLVLLISGGNCLLAVVRDVDDFLLLGKGLDDAPGDAFDKTARRLRLKTLPQCAGLSGGRSVELMAEGGNPLMFDLRAVMSQHVDCNFSFAGIKAWVQREIEKEEIKHGVTASGMIPTVADICASFQYSVAHHLAKRLQRALLFCDIKQLLPPTNRTVVVSGGVSSNVFIRRALESIGRHCDCTIVCPPPRLCTDNGPMIACLVTRPVEITALIEPGPMGNEDCCCILRKKSFGWSSAMAEFSSVVKIIMLKSSHTNAPLRPRNGIERLRVGRGIADDPESIDIQPKCPLGIDITDEVRQCAIKLPRIKILASSGA